MDVKLRNFKNFFKNSSSSNELCSTFQTLRNLSIIKTVLKPFLILVCVTTKKLNSKKDGTGKQKIYCILSFLYRLEISVTKSSEAEISHLPDNSRKGFPFFCYYLLFEKYPEVSI